MPNLLPLEGGGSFQDVLFRWGDIQMTNPFEAARSKAREALANTVIKALNQKGYEE